MEQGAFRKPPRGRHGAKPAADKPRSESAETAAEKADDRIGSRWIVSAIDRAVLIECCQGRQTQGIVAVECIEQLEQTARV